MSIEEKTLLRRSFFGALWHGAFLSLGTALTQPTTVIAAFVSELTASTVWVGGLSTVLTVAGALPQLFVARWIEPRPRKMPFLLLAIYLRVASWGALAWLIFTIGSERPRLLAWALVGLLAIFYAGGGLGGVHYTGIIGKIIPPGGRDPGSGIGHRAKHLHDDPVSGVCWTGRRGGYQPRDAQASPAALPCLPPGDFSEPAHRRTASFPRGVRQGVHLFHPARLRG